LGPKGAVPMVSDMGSKVPTCACNDLCSPYNRVRNY
jgi:hypothetical protein